MEYHAIKGTNHYLMDTDTGDSGSHCRTGKYVPYSKCRYPVRLHGDYHNDGRPYLRKPARL